MITIKEIAAELGLSTTTVSNVIHGKTKEVSAEKLEVVREALRRHNYVPNISARNLATNRSGIIGVAFIDPEKNHKTDAFVGELVGSLEEELSKRGYLMILKISKDTDELVNTVRAWNVDGLIIFGAQEEEGRDLINRLDKPLTFVDSFVGLENPKRGGILTPNIRLCDEEGGYIAGRYLVEKGHKSIAYFTTTHQWLETERYEGLTRAMREAGLEPQKDNYFPLDVKDGSFEYASDRILEYVKRYTAFFCYSDYYAMLLMNLLARHGVRVPEDVSIIGFDDNIYSRYMLPAVTTIRQDPSRKCEMAVENIAAQIEGGDYEQGKISLKVELVERESVKAIV